jgi:hypothetical protein
MLSILGCVCLGALCVAVSVLFSHKVDSFISWLFYWLGITSLVAAMLLAATDEGTGDWVSGVILALVFISIASGAQHQRRRHL